MRRRTDWHRRLHYCGTALLMGPAFGRLLPMPLLAPWAFEATFIAVMIFPIIGVIAERIQEDDARDRGDLPQGRCDGARQLARTVASKSRIESRVLRRALGMERVR